jgi:hypothetical protein
MLRRRSLLGTGLTGLALPAVARAQSGWEPRQPIGLIATFCGDDQGWDRRRPGRFGPHRVPAVPDVPTFAEQGLPALTATTWIGISGPTASPAPLGDAVREATLAAIAQREILAKLVDLASCTPPKPPVERPTRP